MDEVEAGYKDKLITLSDLPAGFRQSGAASEKNGSIGDSSGAFCESMSQTQKDNPPNHEAEVDFESGKAESPDSVIVIEAVSGARKTRPATAKAFDGLGAAFDGCSTFKQTDEDSTIEGTFTKYEFATGAEKTYATHLKASQSNTELSLPFDGDFVVQRKGQFVLVLAVLKLGAATFPSDQLKPLAVKALAKV